MKFKLITFLLFVSISVFSQSEQMALNYFEKGDFEKAASMFEDLVKKQPNNFNYVTKLTSCYQQLKYFSKAEILLFEKLKKFNNPTLYIDLGYNFQLQKNQSKADENYEKAYQFINNNPNYAYSIGQAFEQKSLLDWAYKTYEEAQKISPSMNFDFQLALLQGQMGKLDLMISKLLDFSYSNITNTINVQNQLNYFLQEDTEGNFLSLLKKELILRTQKSQEIYWNQFLSWLYISQKEYNKAFIQEKAIYKRNPDSFEDIIELAALSVNNQDYETAQQIYEFILNNTIDEEIILQANYFILKNKINKNNETEIQSIKEEIDKLCSKYYSSPFSLDILILKAQFYTFQLHQPETGIILIQDLMSKNNTIKNKARLKMCLGDLFTYTEKFNQAIINYAQVENDLPNDELAHEASMRMAKTSFYKKDFDWAKKQAQELKQASSLLIANDAVDLFLLISDNAQDSLKVAISDYSKASLLEFQNKPKEALTAYLQILKTHKDQTIYDCTLYKVGRNYDKIGLHNEALNYYQQIIDNFKDGIYLDEALFYSAELYRTNLNNFEKAKSYYEKIVLEHPDSIYYTEAIRQYRTLRGDKNI